MRRIQQIERRLLSLLRERGFEPLSKKTILEIGCGTGSWLREFVNWSARPENITGIDLLPERVTQAKQLSPSTMTIQCGNASQLALSDAFFDLVFQSTVFTSILGSRTKQQIAAEMLRVVRSDGLIVWYDYHVNNPWSPDVRGVKKQEIHELFPRCHIGLTSYNSSSPSWTLARTAFVGFGLFMGENSSSRYPGIIRKTD